MDEDRVKDDVALMNKAFSEGITEEAEPELVPESEPTPELDVEPESEVEPEPDPETTPEPEPEPESPVEDEKDKTINELRQKLAERESLEPKDVIKETPPEIPFEITDQDFVSEYDMDDLLRDPAELNKLLNKLYKQTVTDTRKTLGEGVLRSIPDIVRANVTAIAELQKASEDFYNENKDLKPFKKVVAAVFEEVASENPGKTYGEILPKVGTEVRNRLELHQKALTVTQPEIKSTVPRLPRKRGRSSMLENQPSTDPLMNELEAMNKTLGR